MSIDPNTLPEGAIVSCARHIGIHEMAPNCLDGGLRITRVFVPVPDGMTLADAEAALADAGAWVGVIDPVHCPVGARMMNRWTNGLGGDNLYVHRDDLPPTDPDAELVEKMARAAHVASPGVASWEDREEFVREEYRIVARATLAALREHEATR